MHECKKNSYCHFHASFCMRSTHIFEDLGLFWNSLNLLGSIKSWLKKILLVRKKGKFADDLFGSLQGQEDSSESL